MRKPILALLVLGLPLVACKGGTEAPSENETAATEQQAKAPEGQAKPPTEQPPKGQAGAEMTRPTPTRPAGPEPIPPPADVAAPPNDAQRTQSGLAYKVLEKGTGDQHPAATDTVRVHYTGWTTDGKMFDSSRTRGEPALFPLNAVIPGWTEGVQLMVPGDKTRFWIPQEMAYAGRPGAPAGMLVFDVELLEIVQPPETPEDVAAPPKDATQTESGVAWKYLERGEGKVKPRAESIVEVHYSGWTTDGKMFDSSYTRGEPAVFPLNRVIPGWTEMVQLMVEGDKVRVWIPEQLAYQGRDGPPKGMLVFDIQLLDIKQQ